MSEWGKVPKEASAGLIDVPHFATDGRLTNRDIRVLMAMCSLAKERRCTADQSTLAALLKSNRRGVNQSVGRLVEFGYLRKEANSGRGLTYSIHAPDNTPAPAIRSTYEKARIPQSLRTAVFERDGFRCQECGAQKDLRADHVHPERHGGEAVLANLQTLCRTCNGRKGARI